MKTRIPVAAALLLAAVQFAHADTIQFLGVPTGVNDGQYYDLPYQIAIDGTADLVSCYDIFDYVNFGDVWNANLLTVTQAASTGYFSKDATPSPATNASRGSTPSLTRLSPNRSGCNTPSGTSSE
jgi:hypothetical protein